MKVRIATIDFDGAALRALAAHYGQERVTRADVRAWAEAAISGSIETIMSDYEESLTQRGECDEEDRTTEEAR